MSTCPSCANQIDPACNFCPWCAARLLDSSAAATRTTAGDGVTAGAGAGGGRFLPGALVTGRYRIIGLLRRGGMGEVYRADDLKLGQEVALKFLPPGLEGHQGRLQRFLQEVRLARQVSHASVCRVYDVGELSEQHFLSMEYVDGEDLASLLRRIGHLPRDKALEIARQLCAGLAAAHAQGIIHRDLKPANVMIDGRGRAKITDFGLAGMAESIDEGEIRSGTPAYMAPEQLQGREVTVRSDLYSLGLVLYELFTGKRAFAAGSTAELMQLQRESSPPTPSSHVDGIDPEVEHLILNCLEPDPIRRPGSALQVAAALPGGDPLAAALASGETPSPQLVADAGETGALPLWVARSLVVLVLLGFLAIAATFDFTMLAGRVPLDKPAAVLAAEARALLEELGYDDPPRDRAHAFEYDQGQLATLRGQVDRPERWNDPTARRPWPVTFWYRESPRYLKPRDQSTLWVEKSNPILTVSGMARVEMDPDGRLLSLEVVPPQTGRSASLPDEPGWDLLFQRAGLLGQDFTPADPEWRPLLDCDVRRAWTGNYPGQPDPPVRVEACATSGRVAYFRLIFPWTEATRQGADPGIAPDQMVLLVLLVLFLGVGVHLARKNLRQRRGDRRGALVLGLTGFVLNMVVTVFAAAHTPDSFEATLLLLGVAWGMLTGAMMATVYLALEPYARRVWPNALISWSRLMAGRLRDPMIGRDILVGAVAGCTMVLLPGLIYVVRSWMGLPLPEPGHASIGGFPDGLLSGLRGVREAVGYYTFLPMLALVNAIGTLFLLLLAQMVLRKRWLALVAVMLVALVLTIAARVPGDTPLLWAAYVVAWGITLVVLTRWGLLALVFLYIFGNMNSFAMLTLDPSAWYLGRSLLLVVVLAALAVYGYLQTAAHPPAGRRLTA